MKELPFPHSERELAAYNLGIEQAASALRLAALDLRARAPSLVGQGLSIVELVGLLEWAADQACTHQKTFGGEAA